jgi:hypothetical protein
MTLTRKIKQRRRLPVLMKIKVKFFSKFPTLVNLGVGSGSISASHAMLDTDTYPDRHHNDVDPIPVGDEKPEK